MENYLDEDLKALAFMIDEENKAQPLPFEELLIKAGTPSSVDWFREYYATNPLFGGSDPAQWTVLTPPPIKRIHAIYGINLPTEKFYYFNKGKNIPIEVDEHYNTPLANYKVKDGFGYETKDTKQKIIKELTGDEGYRSGDGTVPYVSLAYCQKWKKDLHVTFDELEGVEHRAILNNRTFFKKLVEDIAVKRPHQAGEFSPGALPSCLSTLIEDIDLGQ